MDNQRIILWALFGAMLFLTWSKWQADRAVTVVLDEQVINAPAAATPADTPPTTIDFGAELPATAPATQAGAASAPPAVAAAPAADITRLVRVETDVLDLAISRTGGTLVSAALKKYPLDKDAPDVPVQLLSADATSPYLLVSGLVDTSRSGPTHLALLEVDSDEYVLRDSDEVIEVPFRWQSGGVSVEKIYRLKRGHYDIEVEYRVTNGSSTDWRVLSYQQIRRLNNPPERSMFNVDTYSFVGPVVYDGEAYDKLDAEDLEEEPLAQKITGGWIASIEHHFLSAAIPPADQEISYGSTVEGNIVTLQANGPTQVIAPGEQKLITAEFFIGPKLQSQLDATAPGLSLTVDYGRLSILAKPLFWLLEQVHNLVGNWGWSIILVTFMIKAAFYKLTEASGRSMAKMRKLQPRLKALQERYKDDRPALSTHMMDLYKREKVNPAAGCLPMLVQIPFFIAFYWVLLESVEMRQAPFALWITDLSSRDPFFVLPLLMGIAMFIQQKLNPAPPDPVQAKVMSILPIMFTVFFAFFPAGLVLYWLTNSVLSVIQQWNINRKMQVT
jgi:YidC/Oxa1 family membrane protein insertase